MKKIAITLAILLFLSANAHAEDITMGDTLGLFIPTHVNYDVTSDGWDTVFVTITDCQGNRVGDTIWLATESGKGRWIGFYIPSYVANFTRRYHCIWGDGADTVIEKENFTVLDTTAFHGAAAGITAPQVAHATYETLYVHADDFKASCAGTGADTFDIFVFNGDTTAQEGVDICIYNEGKTAKVVPSILTNVNGKAQVFLDAGTYPLYLQRLGVIYAQWDTITVSNGGIDSLWVTSYDPGDAPSASLTQIEGWNRDLGFGKYDRLKISFRPQYSNLIDTAQGVFVTIKEMFTYADTGRFVINLIPSANLISKQPEGDVDSILYDLEIIRGYIKEGEYRNIFVPDTSGTVNLKDILD